MQKVLAAADLSRVGLIVNFSISHRESFVS